MKKINGIETISTHQQQEILRWYAVSQKLVLTTLMFLVAATTTQWYLHYHYAPSCQPCITKAYADEISKKYTASKNCTQNKKTLTTEREKGAILTTLYASALVLHQEQAPNTQLTDLKLTPQGFTARYTLAHRTAAQPCLDQLTASPILQKVALESIEQKNGMNTCTMQATWKK